MSLSLVRTAVEAHIEQEKERHDAEWRERHRDTEPRLFVSDVGSCPRKAIWNALARYHDHPLHVEITHPFSPYVQAIMRAGIVWEEETEFALRAVHGDALQTQVSVRNDVWSGRPDFVLPGFIIEHKATNPYNFKAKDRLPYRHHALQVLAYQRLMKPPQANCKLYYRGWADWAEFAVWDAGEHIGWEGLINGYYKNGVIDANLTKLMEYIERHWRAGVLPVIYENPTAHDFTCVRKTRKGYYPNCPFFGQCWTQENGYSQTGPLEQ